MTRAQRIWLDRIGKAGAVSADSIPEATRKALIGHCVVVEHRPRGDWFPGTIELSAYCNN